MSAGDDKRASCTRCFRHERGIEVIAVTDAAVARACPDCTEDCPHCANERVISRVDPRGYDVLVLCRCQALYDRIDRFNGAGIPVRYKDCTLSSYESLDGNQAEIRQKVRKHLDVFFPNCVGLLLSGNVGTGKTHLLISILRELTLVRGIRCRFVEFTHLLSDIKEGYDRGESEVQVLAPLAQVPVLGVDELGKGLATDWQLAMLDELISRRYNNRLTTYFTTNLPIDQAEVAAGAPPRATRKALEAPNLRARVDERIFSRLHQMCVFERVEGPDARRVAAR